MLREEAEAVSLEEAEDGEGVEGGDAEREGERAENVTVDKAKEKEREGEKDGALVQAAEGQDTTAVVAVKPVQESRDLDFHHVKLSLEWESEWKRALSLAKRGPQPGSGIGMGPLGGMPGGGFGLGGMGPGGMGGLGGGFGGMGGGGLGAGAGANPRAQERETVRPTEAFRLGSLEGVWEGLFTVRVRASSFRI